MVMNKNIRKVKSSRKNGYLMDCINPDCNNRVYIIKSTYRNTVKYKNHKKGFSCGNKECTYSKRAMELKKENMKLKYGVENVGQIPKVKEKIKQTNLKRYGVENPFQIEEVKSRIKYKMLNNIDENGLNMYQRISKNNYENNKIKYEMQGYCNKRKTEETNLKKYGHRIFRKSQYGKMNLNGFILRYGEVDGRKRYNEFCRKTAITLDNLMKKYPKEEAVIRLQNWKNKVAGTLDNFIKRYGEEIGRIKYKKWYESSIGKVSHNQISKISIQFFDELIEFSEINRNRVKYELCLTDSDKNYFYDFCFNNKIIEFNGDYWHANPILFSEKEILTFPGDTKKSAKDLHDYDKIKKEVANNNGYELLTIWEYDYKKNNVDFNVIKKFLLGE